MTYCVSYPDKKRLWLTHDLRPETRPWFYALVKESDHGAVWQWMEETYLLRYQAFYRVWPEWSAEGIWGIPFPGSVSVRGANGPSDFNLKQATTKRLTAWHSNWDETFDPTRPEAFDSVASDAEGFEVAKLVRQDLPSSIYLEYNEFRELVMHNGNVIELAVPEYLAPYCSPSSDA